MGFVRAELKGAVVEKLFRHQTPGDARVEHGVNRFHHAVARSVPPSVDPKLVHAHGVVKHGGAEGSQVDEGEHLRFGGPRN